jgi:transposase InsO family protein
MKAHGLCARGKRKFKATTNSAHKFPVLPNLLERKFSVETPDRIWTGDITYLWTEEGWVYLAVVIDLFSRQVIGFAISERMTRKLVIDALRMAWFRGRPASGLIFHSDRGPIRQWRLPEATLDLRHSRLDEPQGRLLGQCCDRNAVGLVEDRAAA